MKVSGIDIINLPNHANLNLVAPTSPKTSIVGDTPIKGGNQATNSQGAYVPPYSISDVDSASCASLSSMINQTIGDSDKIMTSMDDAIWRKWLDYAQNKYNSSCLVPSIPGGTETPIAHIQNTSEAPTTPTGAGTSVEDVIESGTPIDPSGDISVGGAGFGGGGGGASSDDVTAPAHKNYYWLFVIAVAVGAYIFSDSKPL